LPGVAFAEQIAQANEALGQGNAYILTDNGTTESLVATNLPVTFSFSTDLNIAVPQNVAATLNFDVTTSLAGGVCCGGGTDWQGGFSGYFTITSAVYGNLLSGTFASAVYASGADGGNGLGFSDSDTTKLPSEVQFSSAYLDFTSYTGTELAGWTSSNSSSPLALDANNFLSNNSFAATGTFSATPTPPLVTPEPNTMAMLSGVALLGLGLGIRRRRRKLQSGH